MYSPYPQTPNDFLSPNDPFTPSGDFIVSPPKATFGLWPSNTCDITHRPSEVFVGPSTPSVEMNCDSHYPWDGSPSPPVRYFSRVVTNYTLEVGLSSPSPFLVSLSPQNLGKICFFFFFRQTLLLFLRKESKKDGSFVTSPGLVPRALLFLLLFKKEWVKSVVMKFVVEWMHLYPILGFLSTSPPSPFLPFLSLFLLCS